MVVIWDMRVTFPPCTPLVIKIEGGGEFFFFFCTKGNKERVTLLVSNIISQHIEPDSIFGSHSNKLGMSHSAQVIC